MSTIPKFNSYVCIDDTVNWSHDGFDFTARIVFDYDSKPSDSECYDEQEIKNWKNDEWFFCGVILSVSFKGVELDNNAASLWVIECNIGGNNDYLSEVCEELQSEAFDVAKSEFNRIKALFTA